MVKDLGGFWERTSINVVTNVIRTVAIAVIGILLVPFYLDRLGVGTYALIPLATTITTYIMILVDSMVSACSRYVVIAIQRDGAEGAQVPYNSAFFGTVRVILLTLPLAVLFAFLSPYIFDVPDVNYLEVQVMFGLIFLSAFVSAMASPYNTVFTAYNMLYYVQISRLAYVLLQAGMIVVMFLVLGPSLVSIGVAYLVSSFVLLGLSAWLKHRVCPGLRMDHRDYDPVLFKKMYSLGAWNIVQNIGTLLFIQMSLIITNLFLGPEVQGGFAIVVTFISMTNTATFAISTSMAPLVFREFSEGRMDGLVRMERLAIRLVVLVFALPIAYVIVHSSEILTTWVGPGYTYLSDTITIAMTVQLLYCASLMIANLPEIQLTVNVIGKVTLMGGVLNVILAVMFAGFTDLGIEGVMFGWAVAMALQLLFRFVYLAHRSGAGYTAFLRPVLVGYVLLGGCTLMLHLLSTVIDPVIGWIPILVHLGLLFAVYCLVMYPVLFRKDERRMIANILPGGIRKILPAFIVGGR